MGIGCAGRRRGRQGDGIAPSTAPQTPAIAGCTTQPEQEEKVKTSLNRIFGALTCSRSLASSTMAFSSSNSRQPTPSRRSRSSQPRHRMQTPFRIIGAFRCSWKKRKGIRICDSLSFFWTNLGWQLASVKAETTGQSESESGEARQYLSREPVNIL